jgi:hypothetical protein
VLPHQRQNPPFRRKLAFDHLSDRVDPPAPGAAVRPWFGQLGRTSEDDRCASPTSAHMDTIECLRARGSLPCGPGPFAQLRTRSRHPFGRGDASVSAGPGGQDALCGLDAFGCLLVEPGVLRRFVIYVLDVTHLSSPRATTSDPSCRAVGRYPEFPMSRGTR